jgi:hypothetical protein
MNLFGKMFASVEVKAALGAVDEIAYRYQTVASKMVVQAIKSKLTAAPDEFTHLIRESGRGTPREWVLAQVGNVAADHLESGQHHIYRGVLNPNGPGMDLLKMFDETTDELAATKAIDADYAERQKATVRKNIGQAG